MGDRKTSYYTRRFLAAPHPIGPKYDVNIALAGPLNCGKSALTVRYLTHRFIGEYDPRIEDTYCKLENLGGHDIMVRVMDTSDQDLSGLSSAERYLSWSDCVLLVFSVTSRSSFEEVGAYLDTWRRFSSGRRSSAKDGLEQPRSEQPRRRQSLGCESPTALVKSAVSEDSPVVSAQATVALPVGPAVILVAAKSDLETARQIQRSEAEAFALRHGVPFFETSSAEDCDSVDKIFREAVREGLLLKEQCRSFSRSSDEKELFPPSILQALSGSTSPSPQRTRGFSTTSNSDYYSSSYPSSSSFLRGIDGVRPRSLQLQQQTVFLTPFRKDSKEKPSIFRNTNRAFKRIFQ